MDWLQDNDKASKNESGPATFPNIVAWGYKCFFEHSWIPKQHAHSFLLLVVQIAEKVLNPFI